MGNGVGRRAWILSISLSLAFALTACLDAEPGGGDTAFVVPADWPACSGNAAADGLDAAVDEAVARATASFALDVEQSAALRCLGRLPGNRAFAIDDGYTEGSYTPSRVVLDLPFEAGEDFRAALDAVVATLKPLVFAAWGVTDAYQTRSRLQVAADFGGTWGVGVVFDLESLAGLPVLWDRIEIVAVRDLDLETGTPRPGAWRIAFVKGSTWRDLPTLDLDPAHFVAKEAVLDWVPEGATVTAGPELALVRGRPLWLLAWDGVTICGQACSGAEVGMDALGGDGGFMGNWDGLCPNPALCADGQPLPEDWFVEKEQPLGDEAREAFLAPPPAGACEFPTCPPMDDAAYQEYLADLARLPRCQPIPDELMCGWRDATIAAAEFASALDRARTGCGPFTADQEEALRCLAVRSQGYVQELGTCTEPQGTPGTLSGLAIPVPVELGEDPVLALLRQEGPTVAAAWGLDPDWDLSLAVTGDLLTTWQAGVRVSIEAWKGIPIDDRWAPRLDLRITRPSDGFGALCPLDHVMLSQVTGSLDRRVVAVDPDPAQGIDADTALAAARAAWPLGEPAAGPTRVWTRGSLAWRVDFPAPFQAPSTCAGCGALAVYVDATSGQVTSIRSDECWRGCFEEPQFLLF